MKILYNVSVAVIFGFVIVFGSLCTPSSMYAQSNIDLKIRQTDSIHLDSIGQIVQNYSNGFVSTNFDGIRNSIGQQLIMINGNFSSEPVDWQAHQFLNEKEIDDWIVMMLNNAAPFENKIAIKNVDMRGNSAIVVTLEKGQNKFRNWENEEVAYMLGKTSLEWKIIGIFIKNVKNPD